MEEDLKIFEMCKFEGLSEDTFIELIISNLPAGLSIDFDNGVTKGVIIFKNKDYVLKIPFQGEYEDGEYRSSYTDSRGYYRSSYYGDGYVEHFSGADDNGEGWNYCEAESIRYQRVLDTKDKDIIQLFAATCLIGTINGYPIYRQTKCVPLDDHTSSDHSKDTYKYISDTCEENEYDCFNDEWLADVIEQYGKDTFHKLMNFIRDEDITDLHHGNIGYINDKPVIFDYSSFRR